MKNMVEYRYFWMHLVASSFPSQFCEKLVRKKGVDETFLNVIRNQGFICSNWNTETIFTINRRNVCIECGCFWRWQQIYGRSYREITRAASDQKSTSRNSLLFFMGLCWSWSNTLTTNLYAQKCKLLFGQYIMMQKCQCDGTNM